MSARRNAESGSHPARCIGLGGRQQRIEPEYGDCHEHFSVEYEYRSGLRIAYMGAQQEGISNPRHQRLVGPKGSALPDFGRAVFQGDNAAEIAWDQFNPELTQHADQIDAIRRGQRLNEGRRIAESTLTSIMGRMSAYTGRTLKWDWAMNASKLDLSPPAYEFGDLPMPPVAIPGQTRLV